jgi:antagonist of KipI
MGFRLQGEALEQTSTQQLISSAVSFGTIQLLPNGQLIVLMADHQTTGGYPRIGHVISTSLPKLAQMKAGEQLKFVMTNSEAAEKNLVAQQQYLSQLQSTCMLKMKTWLYAH